MGELCSVTAAAAADHLAVVLQRLLPLQPHLHVELVDEGLPAPDQLDHVLSRVSSLRGRDTRSALLPATTCTIDINTKFLLLLWNSTKAFKIRQSLVFASQNSR